MAQTRKGSKTGKGKVRGRRLPKSLTEEQLESLLGACRGRSTSKLRNLAMLLVMAEGGLRVDEVCNLKLQMVVKEQGEPVALNVIGKGDKERRVHLRQRARGALATWLEKRRANGYPGTFVFCTLTTGVKYPARCEVRKERREDDRRRVVKRPGFVAGTQRAMKVEPGKRVCNRYINAFVGRLAKKAGLPHTTPHQLRHTAAQRLYDSTGDLSVVQELLGHENIDTTTIYARASQLRVKEALDAMDAPEPEREPTAAEKFMAALSPDQRDMFDQALQEANGIA